MINKPPNFPRLRAIYALSKLSNTLTSDILADGSIAERFDITVSRPVRLSNGTVVSQTVLFKAFREAFAGERITTLLDQDGKTLAAEVSIDADGSGLVKIGCKGFRFENARLLTPDAAKRIEFFESSLKRHTLSEGEAEKARTLASKSDFSDDDFLAVVGRLLTSPESFSDSLAPKMKSRQLVLGDLLPEDARYWNQLTAPLGASTSLSEFIARELTSQRRIVLAGDPRKAIRSIALSFCAPALVPIELFRSQDPDTVLLMLEEAAQFADHFSLTGAFEICGDWLSRDDRFGPVGEKLLDKLFSDMQRLKDACAIYGAGFVLATARLHQHQEWRGKPAFWRRLTVAAHASLIARTFGSSSIDPMSLFKWAMNVSGKAYYLSICIDAADEPRWQPDWLTQDLLVADAFGRADAVLRRLPEGAAKEEWAKRVEVARKTQGKEGGVVLATYPAIGESARQDQPSLTELGELGTFYQSFIDNPTIDNLLMLGPVIFSFGIPAECLAPIAKLVIDWQQSGAKCEDVKVQAAALLVVYVAVQLKDVSLADAIAQFFIQNALILGDEGRASEMLFRLVQCAAVDPDRSNARKVLARRLEIFAFVVAPVHLPDVYDSLKILQKLDAELATLLGKALAAARLGSKAA
jgi:hypothetical protein